MLSASQLKQLFAQQGARPARTLGQSFLIFKEAIMKIVAAAHFHKDEVILEIGAGLGALTFEIAPCAKMVIAIEKDGWLIPLLKKQAGNNGNIKIIQGDALDFLNNRFVGESKVDKIIGSPPYYISHRLLRKLAELKNPPDAILLLQKEVAQEAAKNSRPYSALSILLRHRFNPELGYEIKARAFWPQPKIQSRILILKGKTTQPSQKAQTLLNRLLKIGFAHPRKLLLTNLQRSLEIKREALISIFRYIDIPALCRAEELALDQWLKLVDKLGKILETASKKG